MNLKDFVRSFKPQGVPMTLAEKLRSGLAAGTAVLVLGLVLHYLPQHAYPMLLLTPMAASAALSYAAPHSTFAHPWNMAAGHFVSAVCGWVSASLIPEPALAGGVAVGVAIFLTYALRCLHPPGAATALLMVVNIGQFHTMGWQWTIWILLANVGVSLMLALLINRVIPGRHYPAAPLTPGRNAHDPGIIISAADIERALAKMDSVIDVSTDDLVDIYAKAGEHARARLRTASR